VREGREVQLTCADRVKGEFSANWQKKFLFEK